MGGSCRLSQSLTASAFSRPPYCDYAAVKQREIMEVTAVVVVQGQYRAFCFSNLSFLVSYFVHCAEKTESQRRKGRIGNSIAATLT